MKKYLLMGVVGMLVLSSFFAIRNYKENTTVKWATETVFVHDGDTLWELANSYCPKNFDRRDYISMVEELNGISEVQANSEILMLREAE